jgi:hypothetical protein
MSRMIPQMSSLPRPADEIGAMGSRGGWGVDVASLSESYTNRFKFSWAPTKPIRNRISVRCMRLQVNADGTTHSAVIKHWQYRPLAACRDQE